MKVLMRDTFEWVDVTFNPMNNRIECGNSKIADNQILSIKDDERLKYVVCSQCGAIIPNDAKSLKAHREASCSSDACFGCTYMHENIIDTVSKKYTLNEDGTYTKRLNENINCVCAYHYGTWFDINSEDARNNCRSKKCENATFASIKNVFITYLDLFDTMITIDMLSPKLWKFYEKQYNGTYVFKARKKFSLYAYVGNNGVVKYFAHSCDRAREEFLYSHKYNQIFWDRNSTYNKDSSMYTPHKESITEFLHNIYEEATK